MLSPKDREIYEIIIVEIDNYKCSEHDKMSQRINCVAKSPALETTLNNIFLKTAMINLELKYYYEETIGISKYILEQYLIGKSIGVQIYLKEIDTLYKEKLLGKLTKLKDTIKNEIPTKISEIQETQTRVRKDYDKLNKMKQDSQYNDMQRWGIQLSLERTSEIKSRLENLTRLLNYIAEKQKEQK
jgi:hypothetical protein